MRCRPVARSVTGVTGAAGGLPRRIVYISLGPLRRCPLAAATWEQGGREGGSGGAPPRCARRRPVGLSAGWLAAAVLPRRPRASTVHTATVHGKDPAAPNDQPPSRLAPGKRNQPAFVATATAATARLHLAEDMERRTLASLEASLVAGGAEECAAASEDVPADSDRATFGARRSDREGATQGSRPPLDGTGFSRSVRRKQPSLTDNQQGRPTASSTAANGRDDLQRDLPEWLWSMPNDGLVDDEASTNKMSTARSAFIEEQYLAFARATLSSIKRSDPETGLLRTKAGAPTPLPCSLFSLWLGVPVIDRRSADDNLSSLV